jgi:hypothetical protein
MNGKVMSMFSNGRRESMDAKRDGWYAMPHREFREWTGVELGDTRQVYARDARAGAKASLVFMPEGEARRFWRAAREGRLICPVPGCPDPRLTTRHGDDRRDHFVHRQAPGLRHADFPAEVTQQMLHRWAAGLDERLEVLDDQVVAGVKVTVLVRSVTGRQVALCYSSGMLGTEAWQEQHAALERAGVAGVWLLPPRARYFSPPQAQPSPPGEETQGLVLDTHLFKTMRREGSWPLIVNIEREEVANLIVPGKVIATRMGLPRPPFAEDVLHVVVSPLANCTLCKDGMASPAVNKWQLEKIRGGYRRRIDAGHTVRERVRGTRRPSGQRRTGQASLSGAHRPDGATGRARSAPLALVPSSLVRPSLAEPASEQRERTRGAAAEPRIRDALGAQSAPSTPRASGQPSERTHGSRRPTMLAWLVEKLARIFGPRPRA